MGHRVTAVDIDAERIGRLQGGHAPFFEPGLDDLISANLKAGRISFTTNAAEGVAGADAVLLCVPTPAGADGSADLSMLFSAVEDLGPLMSPGTLLITRSTVPVGTNTALIQQLKNDLPDSSVAVVSNPEFLREGHAVEDFMRPERIVIGATEPAIAQRAAQLYESIDCPMVLTDPETAELAKYAANAYLAASISFINEIANIAEQTGADIAKVSEALTLDSRIGKQAYVQPGIGFGGSCLPKDLSALVVTARSHGYDPRLLEAVLNVNASQPEQVIARLKHSLGDITGRTVCVLGVSFKGETFDVRSSPALSVIRLLSDGGARVRAFDPLADGTIEGCIGEAAQLFDDAYAAAAGADAVVIATDHKAFRELDLRTLGARMASRILVDGRNLLDPAKVADAGFSYAGIGRLERGD